MTDTTRAEELLTQLFAIHGEARIRANEGGSR